MVLNYALRIPNMGVVDGSTRGERSRAMLHFIAVMAILWTGIGAWTGVMWLVGKHGA